MILRGERVALRTVTEGDVVRLVAILQEPAVAARWGHPGGDSETDVRRDFLGLDTAFAIELDGEVVGAIGATEEPTPQYRNAGMESSSRPNATIRDSGPTPSGRWPGM